LRTFGTILKRVLIVALLFIGALYAGDYLYLRYKMTKQNPGDPFQVLQVRPLYAIPQKNGKNDFSFGDPETQTCVRSLFPHSGYSPCWYAVREDKKPIFY
jgi:hypothetical protein